MTNNLFHSLPFKRAKYTFNFSFKLYIFSVFLCVFFCFLVLFQAFNTRLII